MKNQVPVPITGRARACLDFVYEQPTKGKTIVDVGCSSGWLEKQLSSSDARLLVGIEVNDEMIELARKNAPKARFLKQEGTVLPIKDSYADIVVLFDVIEHVPVGSEKRMLAETHRILKGNGILLLTTPNWHPVANIFDLAWYFGHRHYKELEIHRFISKSGFEIISAEKKGGVGAAIYLIWLYIAKRLTGQAWPRSRFLESLDDRSYNSEKFLTHFIVAKRE